MNITSIYCWQKENIDKRDTSFYSASTRNDCDVIISWSTQSKHWQKRHIIPARPLQEMTVTSSIPTRQEANIATSETALLLAVQMKRLWCHKLLVDIKQTLANARQISCTAFTSNDCDVVNSSSTEDKLRQTRDNYPARPSQEKVVTSYILVD